MTRHIVGRQINRNGTRQWRLIMQPPAGSTYMQYRWNNMFWERIGKDEPARYMWWLTSHYLDMRDTLAEYQWRFPETYTFWIERVP